MKEILKQIEGLIEHVINMKVTEDTDILLAELNDVYVKLSAQQGVHPTLLTEPVNWCNPVNGVHAPFCTGHKSQSG